MTERLRDITNRERAALGQRFSIARALSEASAERGLRDGLEFEICAETARTFGKSFDGNRPYIPWGAFQRAQTVATSSAGGYLVSTSVEDAVDILRPVSAVARAGMIVLQDLQPNVTIPKIKTTSTGYWLSAETTQVTESTPTFGQIAMSPHAAGDMLQVSRQLLLQSPQADSVIRLDLLRTLGTLVDKAVLSGSGALGQPIGLLNAAGLVSQAGASLTYDGLLTMQESAGNANADDVDLAAITTPSVRRILSNRERATGSGFIWDRNEAAGMPGHVTTAMPSATMVVGPWSTIALGLWGPGFQVEANPFDTSGFKTGIVQYRCLVECDVAVRQAAAFVAATSVT